MMFKTFFLIFGVFSLNAAQASNGSEIRISEAPWTISLRSKTYPHGCGAALIGSRWLLTAGHCLTWIDSKRPLRDQLTAWGGDSDLRKLQALPPLRQIHFPTGFTFKAGFFYEASTDDLALIELEQPVSLEEDSLALVTLPSPEGERGAAVLFSGWGETPFKKALKNEDGVGYALRGFREPVGSMRMPEASPSLLSLYSRKGLCSGDSGSPLVLLREGQPPKLIGIASKMAGKCVKRARKETLFTKVGPFLPWIHSLIQTP